MKYFCLAKSFPLVKLAYSHRFIDNLPCIGTPMFGKFKVTKSNLNRTYNQSDDLIICKTLEDAKKLRLAKIEHSDVSPEFNKGAIAKGYPLGDYGIYEIETNTQVNFNKLNTLPISQLEDFIAHYTYILVSLDKDRSRIPDIEVTKASKAELNPKLINTFYFDLNNDKEVANKSKCFPRSR